MATTFKEFWIEYKTRCGWTRIELGVEYRSLADAELKCQSIHRNCVNGDKAVLRIVSHTVTYSEDTVEKEGV